MLCTYFLSTFATVNHCCAYHDDCYSLQRGQATCDHEFCGCLQHVSEGSPTICNILIMGKCELVSSFGISTYERSKKEGPPQISRLSLNETKMREAVDALYDACPWIKTEPRLLLIFILANVSASSPSSEPGKIKDTCNLLSQTPRHPTRYDLANNARKADQRSP
ncbi:hypothetical protein RB195_018042 [Necator americanus]|uniref:Phospholipase A2 n=1 Tax=Necator americanus TaxID=51031 RepID=A0ABR1C7X3_NECAM